MRAIGIDIGEDSIKIAEVVQNKKQIYINSVFEKKLSPQVSDHDKEIEAIEFVRQISHELDFDNARVVMSLKQDKVTVRKKSFPFSDRLKILKSLSFEMEEDIPFDPDLCLFDAKTILTEGLSAYVLAIAAPKSHIEKVLNLAKDFNITPYTLTVDGVAFSNLLENWDEAPPKYPTASSPLSYTPSDADDASDDASDDKSSTTFPKVAIQITLNLGHKKTILCAQIDGRVVFVRSLMWGADQLIQELVRKFQLPYLEAQKMLQNDASLLLTKTEQNFEAANIASTIEKSLRELVRDIQMSFLELQSEFNGEIKSIYLTGGLSGLANIGAFFTQHFEVATNTINLVDQYFDENKIHTNGASLQSAQSRFTVAVAVALEAFKKPRNPSLQFMKGEFGSDNNKFTQFWQEWGRLTQAAVAMLLILFTWSFFRETYSTTLAEAGSEALTTQARKTAKLPKKQATEGGINRYIRENKKRAMEFKKVEQLTKMNSALDVLQKISESSPSKTDTKIDLIEITIQDKAVKLSGYADTPRSAKLFSQYLSQISSNNKITEEPPNLPSLENRVAFSYTFTADRGLTK